MAGALQAIIKRLDGFECPAAGGASTTKPPWARVAAEPESSETKQIKEPLAYWQKAACFATHDADRVLAEEQVEKLQRALQEATPLHVQQRSIRSPR